MPFPEIDKLWTFTSSGSGVAVDGTGIREWTFHIVWAPGSTGTVEMQTFLDANSTLAANSTMATVIGSSQVVTSSAGTAAVLQFTGPFGSVSPRVVKMTGGSSGIISVRGIGN